MSRGGSRERSLVLPQRGAPLRVEARGRVAHERERARAKLREAGKIAADARNSLERKTTGPERRVEKLPFLIERRVEQRRKHNDPPRYLEDERREWIRQDRLDELDELSFSWAAKRAPDGSE